MEQVTEGVSVKEVNNVTVTEEDLNYYTHGIFSYIKLDSSFVWFSSYLLLEIYYNKLNQIKTFNNNEHLDIDLFFYGTEEANINNINNLIKDLEKAYGSFATNDPQVILRTKRNSEMKLDYIQLRWRHIPRRIIIWSTNYKNPNESMMYCETANGMMHWTHDLGLIVSPYAKIALESNQIIPGPKFKKPVSNISLMELLLMGFSISSYVKTHLFANFTLPLRLTYEKFSEWSKDGHLINLPNDSTITKEDIKWYDVSSLGSISYYSEVTLHDLTKLAHTYYKTCYGSHIGILHSGKVDDRLHTIIFEGVVKQFITWDLNCYLVVTIPDNDMGKQFVKIVEYLINLQKYGEHEFEKTSIHTCIINSNFLSPEEKSICNVSIPRPNLNLLDYLNENNLVLLVDISLGAKIIDVSNKQTILEGFYDDSYNFLHNEKSTLDKSSFDKFCACSSHFTNKPNTKVNFWSEFIFGNIFDIGQIKCMTRFMVLQN